MIVVDIESDGQTVRCDLDLPVRRVYEPTHVICLDSLVVASYSRVAHSSVMGDMYL